MAVCIHSNRGYMYWTGRFCGAWLCFDCLVDARLEAAREAGTDLDRTGAACDVVYRLGRGGGVGLADGSGCHHDPVSHDRLAGQLAIASGQDRPVVLCDFLLAPSDDEDPRQVGTTLPAYQTRDSRFGWPFAVRCDSCPRFFDDYLPGDTPCGAFVFACPEDRGIEVVNGLPAHHSRSRAFREKIWDARFQCVYCVVITYGRSLEEVTELLSESAVTIVPPLATHISGQCALSRARQGSAPRAYSGPREGLQYWSRSPWAPTVRARRLD